MKKNIFLKTCLLTVILLWDNKSKVQMKYIDKYPGCQGCPVIKYCGKMVGSIRLCNSYKENHDE